MSTTIATNVPKDTGGTHASSSSPVSDESTYFVAAVLVVTKDSSVSAEDGNYIIDASAFPRGSNKPWQPFPDQPAYIPKPGDDTECNMWGWDRNGLYQSQEECNRRIDNMMQEDFERAFDRAEAKVDWAGAYRLIEVLKDEFSEMQAANKRFCQDVDEVCECFGIPTSETGYGHQYLPAEDDLSMDHTSTTFPCRETRPHKKARFSAMYHNGIGNYSNYFA